MKINSNVCVQVGVGEVYPVLQVSRVRREREACPTLEVQVFQDLKEREEFQVRPDQRNQSHRGIKVPFKS